MQKRLPRFKRVPIATPLWLGERDWQIIRLVHRHRFLRSDQIAAFIGGSQQGIVRRLQLLFHHSYLERPLAQLESYYRPGSRAIVYGLGNKGEELVKQEFGISPSWRDKNRAVGRMLLEHTLLVADVMVSIELACRKRGDVQVVYEDDLATGTKRQPFQWRVTIPSGEKLTVIPDFVFALTAAALGGPKDTATFNEARDILVGVLRQIAGYIQSLGLTNESDVLSSGFDIILSGKSPRVPLAQPGGIKLDNSISGQLGVALTSVPNAKAYQVQYGTGTGAWLEAGIFPNTRGILIHNLTPGTVYSVRVRAVGGSTQYSPWSNAISLMAI